MWQLSVPAKQNMETIHWDLRGCGSCRERIRSVDQDFDPRQIDEAFIGSVAFGGAQLGNTAALLTEHSGMQGVGVRRVENACASSGFALRDAWMAIKSGQADIVVAGGIEKMNDLSPERKLILAGSVRRHRMGTTCWTHFPRNLRFDGSKTFPRASLDTRRLSSYQREKSYAWI